MALPQGLGSWICLVRCSPALCVLTLAPVGDPLPSPVATFSPDYLFPDSLCHTSHLHFRCLGLMRSPAWLIVWFSCVQLITFDRNTSPDSQDVKTYASALRRMHTDLFVIVKDTKCGSAGDPPSTQEGQEFQASLDHIRPCLKSK
jgi:hypothetical protein